MAAKTHKPKGKANERPPEIEIEPGAWERFKSAVHMMARPKAAKPFKDKSKQDSGKAGKPQAKRPGQK
jgi:hypothetical protein